MHSVFRHLELLLLLSRNHTVSPAQDYLEAVGIQPAEGKTSGVLQHFGQGWSMCHSCALPAECLREILAIFC